MLRLESYLAPVLSSFLNKYIKNLKADALQLSLWGGEATFYQLELRLDNIENEFDLPLELNSGLVRELKIRVRMAFANHDVKVAVKCGCIYDNFSPR